VPSASKPGSGTETVLLVEDGEELRNVTRRLLQRQGYTVVVAANAGEALRAFEENAAIDVVLTDVVMPGGSGPDLAKQILERRKEVKIIFMSGYPEKALGQHVVLNHGVVYLHKPVNSDTLCQTIRDVLTQ
jgi:CheY-like chemotaxis protein